MRLLIVIDPGDLLTGLHRYLLRIEGEVFDLDLVRVASGARFARIVSVEEALVGTAEQLVG